MITMRRRPGRGRARSSFLLEATMKKLIFLLVLVATVGGAGTWYWHTNSQPRSNFRTAKVFHGPLRATIGATGTLEPEEVVDIGAQVAGRIEYLGQDPADAKKVIN